MICNDQPPTSHPLVEKSGLARRGHASVVDSQGVIFFVADAQRGVFGGGHRPGFFETLKLPGGTETMRETMTEKPKNGWFVRENPHVIMN